MKHGRRGRKFILLHCWTSVIWKMLNWRQSTKNTRVEMYSEGGIVKDDSGSYAVFTEQRSLASQMTAAKVMDIISILSGCAGQAANAVSAFTQIEMEDAPKLLQIPKSECPDIWIRLPRHKWPKSWSSMEDPVVPLDRNLYGHPLAGLFLERQFEKILLKHGWEKVSNWECLFAHREKGLFLSVYVDDKKLAGKKQNLDPMWKLLNKEVDLGDSTSFLDHVYLGCTQRRKWTEKLPFPQNIRISSWSYDMEGHVNKCGERYCELANKTTQQLHKVSTPCIDDPPIQRRRNEIRGRIVKSMLPNCSEMLRIRHVLDDLIFYGQWTNLNDRLQNGPKHVSNDWGRLISKIHQTCEYKQYCYVGNIAKQCRLVLVSRLRFLQEILRTQNPLLEEHCAFFWMSYVCSNKLMIKCQETEHAVKSEAKISKPSWTEAVTEMLMKCQMWITLSQTQFLLDVKLSCVYSETTKLWWRWSSKAEARRWDTFPEPTVSPAHCVRSAFCFPPPLAGSFVSSLPPWWAWHFPLFGMSFLFPSESLAPPASLFCPLSFRFGLSLPHALLLDKKAFAFCSPEQDPLSHQAPSSFPREPFSSSPLMSWAVLAPTHSTLMRSTFPWPCLVNVHNLQLALWSDWVSLPSISNNDSFVITNYLWLFAQDLKVDK